MYSKSMFDNSLRVYQKSAYGKCGLPANPCVRRVRRDQYQVTPLLKLERLSYLTSLKTLDLTAMWKL